MPNKKTVALTKEQYKEIIETIMNGCVGCRPNERVAFALQLEANLGLRVSDVVRLTLNSFVKDGNRYRLAIVEQKTGKQRVFTIPNSLMLFIQNYALRNNIDNDSLLVPITTREIQKVLAVACDHLGYEGISTHSFRKMYASEIYRKNGYDISLVQILLQHSSPAVTQRYIGISSKQIEDAIENNLNLI